MIANMEKNFEETAEIYAGFPLKAGFMDMGNLALASFGLQAVLDDGVIRIPFVDRPLYTQEELDELCDSDETEEDMKTWRVRVEACIELADDPSLGIRDVYCEHEVIVPWADEDDDYNDCFDGLNEMEYQQSIILFETFLNVTVDCGE